MTYRVIRNQRNKITCNDHPLFYTGTQVGFTKEDIERICHENSDFRALLPACEAETVEDEEFDYDRSLAEEMYDDLLNVMEIIKDEQLSGEFEWDGNPDWDDQLYAHRCSAYPHLRYLFCKVF